MCWINVTRQSARTTWRLHKLLETEIRHDKINPDPYAKYCWPCCSNASVRIFQLARRRARREQARAVFRITLNWLLTFAHGGIAGRPFRRGFEEVPRHT